VPKILFFFIQKPAKRDQLSNTIRGSNGTRRQDSLSSYLAAMNGAVAFSFIMVIYGARVGYRSTVIPCAGKMWQQDLVGYGLYHADWALGRLLCRLGDEEDAMRCLLYVREG